MSTEPSTADVAGESVLQDCPNCGRDGLSPFYEARDIPAHSCLLMPDRRTALEYPRGQLHLGHCSACGFITNLLFDEALHEYSPRYEETQHFSGTFNAFARSLAQRLVDDYSFRDKDVLEIGCGKGEFLALLCELGDNRGIGIDPGCIPGRMTDDIYSRITFIQDFYSEKYSHLQADMVCCRHTLEHIHRTREFLQMIRRAIGDRPETLVFFELPDATRVLREPAFWDIYYEHCSYFTAGSLAGLFRECHFDVVELARDYDDQYLLLMAYPTDSPTSPRLELEDDLTITARDVEQFTATCTARIREWTDRITRLAQEGRRPVAWGSGSKCVSFFSTIGITGEIEYVVDINPYKHGKFLPGAGHEIVAPEFLKQYRPEAVIVMNPVYCEEIGQSLSAMGVEAELIPV